MAFVKGRNIRIEVSKTFGTAVNVTAVSKALTAVATASAHGLQNGASGYFRNVSGMVQLEGQGVRVANSATNTFEMPGLNTVNYSDFSSAEFVPVTAWDTLAEATNFSTGGGSFDKIDTTCLIDVVKREEAGQLASQSVDIQIRTTETPSVAMNTIIAAAQAGGKLLFRVNMNNGAGWRVFMGEPSLSSESVDTGGVGSGSISIAVKGLVLSL